MQIGQKVTEVYDNVQDFGNTGRTRIKENRTEFFKDLAEWMADVLEYFEGNKTERIIKTDSTLYKIYNN
ncbi:MAG: hypothetical protein SNJ77_01945 [Cytophagales bacterium]